ncbi:MAG: molybdenum cofactor guanylyltransferase [Candidatus Aminicenantia bacterium]
MTGIILAGGESKRLKDKAFLKVGQKTIIEELIAKLIQLFEEIIIVVNSSQKFKHLGVRLIKDLIPSKGPLGGLYSGLSVSSNVHNFLIACDMPFINPNLIKYMSQQIEDYDIVVPLTNRGFEALYAFYSINCLEKIKKQIEAGNLKIIDIYPYFKVRYITPREIEKFDPEGLSFFNMNTEEDLEKARKIANLL